MAVQVRLSRVTGSVSTPNTIAATGFTDGDLILLQVRNQTAGVVVTVPAGFTLLYSVTGTTQEVRVYYKIASSESGNYSVSWTGGGTSRLGIVALYSDAGKTLQLDGHATQDNTSSSTNLPCPSITTSINGAVRVDFVGINNANNTSAGSGQTKQYDTGGTSTVAAFTQTISTAGATGTRTPTGDSSQSSRVIVVAYAETPAPTDPSDLVATAVSATQINLTWADNATSEDNYSLERSANGTTGWSVINSPVANATSYSNTGLTAGTNYYYRIRAHNGGGYSGYSNIAHGLTLSSTQPVSQPRLFLLEPEVVFAARVNLVDPASYPVAFIAFDGVTTGTYTDIKAGMTVLLGSSAGGDQYGRQRVRDGATAIKFYVGLSSQGAFDGELTLVDDAYITIVDLRMLWAKMPFIDSAGEVFKDADIEVNDHTTNPPPVANCGSGYAATLNSDDVIIVRLDGGNSFAVADAAEITDYLWDIKDGTLLVGSSLTDATIDVSFPAGFRYVELTVTDSNGETHTACAPVVADDPDDRLSTELFIFDSHRITDAGQTLTVRMLQDVPRVTYPDGTLAMIWIREPMGITDRDHMVIVGWLDTEDSEHNAGKFGLLRNTRLTILDVAKKLDTLPGFAQQIADDNARDSDTFPEITWNFMVRPTMDRWMHYLLHWHSNALDLADFVWSGTDTQYTVVSKTSDGESLWQQVRKVAQAMCPGYVLTCDRGGAILVVADPMFQDPADRTSTVQVSITEDDWNNIKFSYRRAPRTHWLRTGAQLHQTDVAFNEDGTIYLPVIFGIAPGSVQGQGLGAIENNELLAGSQTILNNATGQMYARMNAALGMVTITLVQDDSDSSSAIPWREIEPAYKEWVTLVLSEELAAQRGLIFDTARGLPLELNIRYNQTKMGLTRTIDLTWEQETSGQPAETFVPPAVPAVGDEPIVIPPQIPPPDAGLVTGADMVAAIGKFKLYRTSNFTTTSGSGGPTWAAVDLTGSEEILSWVVDPFSPGYIDGTGAINGFVATADNVYRVSDLFGTPIVNAILEFATTASWRTIQASFGSYFTRGSNPWLICVSYYGSTGGHAGTWAAYSLDGGTTWAAEVQVSAYYDSGGAVSPIGLYCSPKTPGLAYCAAHLATANPATAGGYVSTDWGATWSAMAGSPDPAHPNALFGDFADGNSSSTVTHTYTEIGLAPSATYSNSKSGSGNVDYVDYLCVAPPANAKRVTISGTCTGFRSGGGFGNSGYHFGVATGGANLTRTVISDTNNGATGKGQTYIQNFVYQYDFSDYVASDWPHNRDLVQANPSPAYTDYPMRFLCGISSGGVTSSWTAAATVSLTVTEIILDDGTTYTPQDAGIIAPVHGQAGELHLPWEDNDAENVFYYGAVDRTTNRQFKLKRTVAGTVTDISPSASGVHYGVNAGHFSVRAHDSDRSKMLLAGTGNDASGSSTGDKQGVWASTDNGDTWTQIVAPTTGTEVYQAAFGGDDSNIVYIWGPASYFGYSSNMGSSIDSRAGNLAALSATKIIGIAGGQTG